MSHLDRYPVGPHRDIRGPDTCDRCAHSRPEVVYGVTVFGTPTAIPMLLCKHPEVIEHFRCERVSAGAAREYDCAGLLFQRGASA